MFAIIRQRIELNLRRETKIRVRSSCVDNFARSKFGQNKLRSSSNFSGYVLKTARQMSAVNM